MNTGVNQEITRCAFPRNYDKLSLPSALKICAKRERLVDFYFFNYILKRMQERELISRFKYIFLKNTGKQYKGENILICVTL